MSQLSLDLEPQRENPNAHLFHPDGSMRNVLWPGDTIRMAHERGDPAHVQDCPICRPWPLCRWGCCRVKP